MMLPEASDVSLEIFNINGQKVQELVNQRYDAGYHTLIWDGREAASCVYFYKLTAGSLNETKIMVLLK